MVGLDWYGVEEGMKKLEEEGRKRMRRRRRRMSVRSVREKFLLRIALLSTTQ